MKYKILVLLFSTLLILSGCFGDKAKDIFETAQLEELQNARKHAKTLYQQIVDKYPKSEYAQKSKERLSTLNEIK